RPRWGSFLLPLYGADVEGSFPARSGQWTVKGVAIALSTYLGAAPHHCGLRPGAPAAGGRTQQWVASPGKVLPPPDPGLPVTGALSSRLQRRPAPRGRVTAVPGGDGGEGLSPLSGRNRTTWTPGRLAWRPARQREGNARLTPQAARVTYGGLSQC